MKKILIIITLITVSLQACKKDKKNTVETPPTANEQELITTFKVLFEDVNNVQPDVLVQFVDLDGPGGNDPSVFDTIRLVNNTSYTATISLLNESVSPAEDITVEVAEEAVDHLLCFELTSGLNVSVTATDLDANNLPLGLQTLWICQAASVGYTTIRLKHQPGMKTGACNLGDTDVELVFRTEIL